MVKPAVFSDQSGVLQENKNSSQKQTQNRVYHDPFGLFRFIEGTVLPAGTVFCLRIKFL